MRVCSISWSPEKDDTKIKFNEDFEHAHIVARLDILQDSICMLQEEYEKTRQEFRDSAKSAKLATS
jgi:hypothetical protein